MKKTIAKAGVAAVTLLVFACGEGQSQLSDANGVEGVDAWDTSGAGHEAQPATASGAPEAGLSRRMADTTGEHEFIVRLEHGVGVDEETARGMLETLEIVPRSEAFPELPASLMEAREPASASLEADEVSVLIEPVDPGVEPTDYAWRTAIRTPVEATAAGSAAGTLGSVQQPLSFDVVLPPNAAHNTPAISCNLVSLTWGVGGGSGTVCLQNRSDDTQECRSATAFIKQLTGASFPVRKSWRARLVASSSGLAARGDLLCL